MFMLNVFLYSVYKDYS